MKWNADGLVPAIAQEAATGEVLTLAWMNREALARTARTGEAHYWSRSRRRLWRKGEESGHVQKVREVRLDCDSDADPAAGGTGRRHRLPHRARALLLPAGSRAATLGETSSRC